MGWNLTIPSLFLSPYFFFLWHFGNFNVQEFQLSNSSPSLDGVWNFLFFFFSQGSAGNGLEFLNFFGIFICFGSGNVYSHPAVPMEKKKQPRDLGNLGSLGMVKLWNHGIPGWVGLKFKIISFQPLPWAGTIPALPARSSQALGIPGMRKMGWKDPSAGGVGREE